jgi:GrpB-like predicted nucleotidyltransferase (UPF0157 family)
MLTTEQKEWLDHLDDKNKIETVPYNPDVKRIFAIVKKDLRKVLGKVRISHCGSTSLKISGQGEIDLYIPVIKRDFNSYLNKLIKYLGKPGTVYELERVRFVKYVDDIKIEIFLINKNCDGWKNCLQFGHYLKRNPGHLNAYAKLKDKASGQSIKNYYTAKIVFINKILKLASKK